MRTLEYGTTTHVPAFLTKLWKLVTDESCNELISWSYAGSSFIIYDEIRFSKELLPMYFKHNNMASFVRQLNMYGFRKLSCIDQGGMHCYKNEIEFYHQYFLKGQESLLELIKRKIPNSKSEEPRVKQEYIEELIANIKALKGKQDYTENGMRNLRRENKALWKHINFLTDRYSKQQSVLQQLLPFFMSMMRSSREMALKRKSPLMIDEGESTQNKLARLSPPYYVHEQDSNMSMPSSPGNVTNRGPVIHDVTEMESSKMFPGSILRSSNTAPSNECEVVVDSPLSCNLESSKQAIDSSFTEPGSMEALNIINQNFESRSRSSSMGSSIDVKPSSRNLASLNVQMASSPPMPSSAMGSYTRTSSTPSSTIIIDETTSDVPLMKIEDSCSENSMYNIGSLMSERVSAIIDEETVAMLENPTLMNDSRPSPTLREPRASSGGKFLPNCFLPQMKEGMPEMNWMMNQPPPPEPFVQEPSFENWLGQIIKSDNLTPGCSLPHTATTALPGNVNFGYVNYPEKRT